MKFSQKDLYFSTLYLNLLHFSALRFSTSHLNLLHFLLAASCPVGCSCQQLRVAVDVDSLLAGEHCKRLPNVKRGIDKLDNRAGHLVGLSEVAEPNPRHRAVPVARVPLPHLPKHLHGKLRPLIQLVAKQCSYN